MWKITESFNEAAALLPRKAWTDSHFVVHHSVASMRPRHCCRGRPMATEDGGTLYSVASMRPRHCCRGRQGGAAQVGTAQFGASMRPRHCCRGRPSSTSFGIAASPCFNEAAALLPRKASRGHLACHGTARCFNEAAALLPRKAGLVCARTAPAHLASMRPRHCCRGRLCPVSRASVPSSMLQ